jgi:hypothetical protein
MKRTTASPALVALLCVVFAATLAPTATAEDHPCSNRSVAGAYGYTTTGTRLGIGPVAGVGIFTLDRNGDLSGKQTVSFNGTIADETYTGNYTVNSDCTGTATLVVVSSIPAFNRTSTLDLVWVDNSNAIRMIFTNAQTIITVDAKKRFSEQDQ